MTSLGPGHQHQESFFDSSFNWKVGYNMSLQGFDGFDGLMDLKGLMDFLAFLVPKLWLKYNKLIREIPA